MSTRKWVDKKKDKTYKVVYRSHDDPLFHDQDASEHVLVEVQNPNNKKIKTKAELEKELGDEVKKVRANEGEAALYGITFDDSKYDYMQHLKPIGDGDGVFIPRKDAEKATYRSQGIQFKEFDLPEDIKPSTKTVGRTYQDQQSLPDEIAGFKPDMNPALREVLEALEDEAYIDDDGKIFDNLLESGEQVDDDEFNDQFDEWDLDNYEDEMAQYETQDFAQKGDQGWEAGFRQFKAQTKHKKNEWESDDEFEDEDEDVLPDLPTFKDVPTAPKKGAKSKERKKKGAMTNTTSFSMTSSALFRTEALTLLDDKFEKVIKDYKDNEEREEEHKPFNMETERADFEDMLDDFLDNYEIEGGRRLVKKNEELYRLKKAADSASKGKLAQRRKKDNKDDVLPKAFGNLKI